MLLGSASGESLAGSASTADLTPLLVSELRPDLPQLQSLWLRGVFPLSHLTADDESAFQWRQDFIGTFLRRDLPDMGVRVPAETMRRFWTMLAHLQGQLFNASQLGVALGGASYTTATRYLDVLVDTLMVRRLQPYLANVGKRLVKSPKVYLRDSAGASWEGFVVEQVAAHLPPDAQIGFYRTAAGAEIDLVIEHRSRRIGVEIKFSAAPKPAKGFWQAAEDLKLDRAVVMAPVQRAYPLAEGVDVVPVSAAATLV